jgi:peptidoglycan/xylan/chitin deacetylase (PgdA/CDA1 family)
MKLVIILFLGWSILCFDGCKKFDKRGYLDQPGVALTFDDYSINNWYHYLPLFDSFGIKVTFYVSQYHLLNQDQKNKLKAIQNRGHEIAYHTTTHPNMLQYLRVMGMENLVQYEINDDLSKMNRDGFYPRTFAYPYGAHNKVLDDRLLRIFKSVRALNGSPDYTKSVTTTTSNTVLFGLDIDNNSISLATIERLINVARQNNNCLVLVGHQIQNPRAAYQVSYAKLKFILQKVKDLNMRFYTASEISN